MPRAVQASSPPSVPAPTSAARGERSRGQTSTPTATAMAQRAAIANELRTVMSYPPLWKARTKTATATPADSPWRRSAATTLELTPSTVRPRSARWLGAGTLSSGDGRAQHPGGDREEHESDQQRVGRLAGSGSRGRGRHGGAGFARPGFGRRTRAVFTPLVGAPLLLLGPAVRLRRGWLLTARRSVGRSGRGDRSRGGSDRSGRHDFLRVGGGGLPATRGDALDVLVRGG